LNADVRKKISGKNDAIHPCRFDLSEAEETIYGHGKRGDKIRLRGQFISNEAIDLDLWTCGYKEVRLCHTKWNP